MIFGRSARVRSLRAALAEPAMQLALREPALNALAGGRLRDLMAHGTMAREFSVHGPDAELDGVLWHGVNASPVGASARALQAFAAHLAGRERRTTSIIGPREDVERMWAAMGGAWSTDVREYRWSQPVLVASEGPAASMRPAAPGETALRQARIGEERAVYPAAVAMFREEVGLDPTLGDDGRAYMARVTELVREGRTYVITDEDGRVVFKADVGALFGPVAQIHGVWTAPDLRGQGFGSRAMAQLVPLVQAAHAPQVSLYVNDFNEAARRAYATAGFRPVGELSTILF